jgi:hypothetical protein
MVVHAGGLISMGGSATIPTNLRANETIKVARKQKRLTTEPGIG